MTTTNDTSPAGLILLAHTAQIGITHNEMIDALPAAHRALPSIPVELDVSDIADQAIHSGDWSTARRVLEERFEQNLAPLLKKHPDYRIVYFGSAPIPLTIHLGFLLETWQQIDVVPRHHHERVWGWRPHDHEPPRLKPMQLPEDRDRSPGVAIVRVSTSHVVDAHATRDAIAEDPLIEIDISLEHPGEDVFSRIEEMHEVAVAFRHALDDIGDRFLGIERVHLFAAVQPGVALLLGAQTSPTMHPEIQTYQYARNASSPPYHKPAILINGPARPAPGPLTDEERRRAAEDRGQLDRDLDRIKAFAGRESKETNTRWIDGLLLGSTPPPELSGQWLALPRLCDTKLLRTSVDCVTDTVSDSFLLDPLSNSWKLDDHWLARLARRLPSQDDRHRALRLLVLHELVHRGPQRLTSTSSQGIGRFPKVLEEMDYHADLWAMLYEHALEGVRSQNAVANPRSFFQDLIRIATETMWAFFDDGEPLKEIQIRHLHRYLNWYWQYLRLEVEDGAAGMKELNLESVLSILAQRPLVELAGPKISTSDERIYFALDLAPKAIPELAIYHDGKLHRSGQSMFFNIKTLLEAVKQRDAEGMRNILRAAVEQAVR
jgi:hypothetical protein